MTPHNPHRPQTTICTILFAVMLLLTIGTESAIKNGHPRYIQFLVFSVLTVGFAVAGAVEIVPGEKEEPK